VNDQHLYYLQEKNFGESEGKLSFANSLKRLLFNNALNHNQAHDRLFERSCDSNVHVFSRKYPLSYHEYKDN